MRRLTALVLDIILIALATLCADFIRNDFQVSLARFVALGPYLALSIGAAACVLPLAGLHRSVWRYSALSDYVRILVASALVVVAAVALGFTVNRLAGVARSLPVLQLLLIGAFLGSTRLFMRLRHNARLRRSARPKIGEVPQAAGVRKTVLLVGLNHLTDLYLSSVAEFVPGRISVAGLLGRERHTGRTVHGVPVLGMPEQIADVLRDLEVRGVHVDLILVTSTFEALSLEAQTALRNVEASTSVSLEFIAERLGLHERADVHATGLEASSDKLSRRASIDPRLSIDEAERSTLIRRPYWRIKRGCDVLASLTLLLVAAPFLPLLVLVVAWDVGLPLMFSQQRPGLGGAPFKVFKLRTMLAAHDHSGQRVPDHLRSSALGHFLRRSRLDELPQLFNILRGDMSFVGPRPLLPVDQPLGDVTRLLVRPGLTGWAQISGGRSISPEDKAALDLWYLKNASLALDMRILVGTLLILVRGERRNDRAIEVARLVPKAIDKPGSSPMFRSAADATDAIGKKAA